MPFLRRCWYVASWSSELSPGQVLAVTVAGKGVVLFRDAAGTAVALRDRCAHRFAPLSRGRLEPDGLRCMYHGLKFGPDGRCVAIPGQSLIPETARVRTYPVVEREDWIWIWLGEHEMADPALIPDSVPLDHPDWAMRHGFIDYEADYMLINDNLLDFSHLSFVHPGSFGAAEGWALTRPTISPLPRGVRVQRWVEDQPRSNSRPDLPATNIDHWSSYDYLVPGVLISTAHTYAVGTAKQFPRGQPPPEVAPFYSTVTCQAVTPIDQHRCRYFFSRGLPRREASEERLDKMMAVTEAAFMEDRNMIEAQQKVIRSSGDDRMVVIEADRALVIFRKTMERLRRAELAQGAAERA